jgi:hypothetical protein
MSQGRRNFQRSRRQAICKARLRLNQRELDLGRQQHAFHCERYTRQMLAMHRDASISQQRAEIERLYFAATGKHLKDALEQHIIETLRVKYLGAERRSDDNQPA